jgi:hypothetical protein
MCMYCDADFVRYSKPYSQYLYNYLSRLYFLYFSVILSLDC